MHAAKRLALAAAILTVATPAVAGLTDYQKCRSYQLKMTGKLAFCLLKAEATFVKLGDLDKYDEATTKCRDKHATLIAKSSEKWGPTACPTIPDLEDPVDVMVDALINGTAPCPTPTPEPTATPVPTPTPTPAGFCGDGIFQPGEEVCDDGNNASGDGCASDCLSDESCGNGILDVAAGEQCDDSNLANGDGCDQFCQAEF